MSRPAVFIGSSSEGIRIAQSVQVLLDPICQVEVWSQGVFGLSQGNLEALVSALPRFDFGVLVLTTDDLVVARGVKQAAARDNVLFELGLFMGALGRERTFMLYDRTDPPHLPSDLAGITAATYALHDSGNLRAALGAPCTLIQEAVERYGMRRDRGFEALRRATSNVEDVGVTMQTLVRLLARSRKVELDIISSQFGPVIDPAKLREMQRDLADLEATLRET